MRDFTWSWQRIVTYSNGCWSAGYRHGAGVGAQSQKDVLGVLAQASRCRLHLDRDNPPVHVSRTGNHVEYTKSGIVFLAKWHAIDPPVVFGQNE